MCQLVKLLILFANICYKHGGLLKSEICIPDIPQAWRCYWRSESQASKSLYRPNVNVEKSVATRGLTSPRNLSWPQNFPGRSL